MIGYYFKEHEPNSLPKLYLLYALTGALIDGLWLPAAKIVEGKPIAEFAFPKYIVQDRASVCYRLTFTYHLFSYLRPYILRRPHENEGCKTA